MKKLANKLSNLRLLGLVLCGLVLNACSQEVPTEVTPQSPKVVTGPFLIRDTMTYHQDTNEPVTGVVEEFYSNGQLRKRENLIDGKQDGVNETYYENGQLWTRLTYIDGEPEGLSEWFHENGRLWTKSTYIDGEQEGLWEYFDLYGQLLFRGNYKDGKKDGLEETFDQNGNLYETQTYRNGALVEENNDP